MLVRLPPFLVVFGCIWKVIETVITTCVKLFNFNFQETLELCNCGNCAFYFPQLWIRSEISGSGSLETLIRILDATKFLETYCDFNKYKERHDLKKRFCKVSDQTRQELNFNTIISYSAIFFTGTQDPQLSKRKVGSGSF